MLGDIAGRVRFDEQVKEAWVLVRRDWGIRANDFFGLTIDLKRRSDGNMLTNGKT